MIPTPLPPDCPTDITRAAQPSMMFRKVSSAPEGPRKFRYRSRFQADSVIVHHPEVGMWSLNVHCKPQLLPSCIVQTLSRVLGSSFTAVAARLCPGFLPCPLGRGRCSNRLAGDKTISARYGEGGVEKESREPILSVFFTVQPTYTLVQRQEEVQKAVH